MADFSKYYPKLLAWEGNNFMDIPKEVGSCSKYGLTVNCLRDYYMDNSVSCSDVKVLTLERAYKITKELFWDNFIADSINNQSLAEYIVDAGFNQGKRLITKYIQMIIGAVDDGVFTRNTLNKLNNFFSKDLFQKLKEKRTQRYLDIINKDPSKKIHLKEWLRRCNSWEYQV